MLPPAYYYFMVLVVRSALLYHTRESGGVPRDSAKSDAMKPVCLVYIVFVLCGCMYLSPTVWPIPQSRKNGLHSYSSLNHCCPSKLCFICLTFSYPYLHTHRHTHRLTHKKQHRPGQTSNQPVGSSERWVGVLQGYLGT